MARNFCIQTLKPKLTTQQKEVQIICNIYMYV